MAILYNSGKTADTVNRAIDNSMGTTTTTQGAAAAGKIITEDLQPVVQCVNGYDKPQVLKSIEGVPPLTFHAVEQSTAAWTIEGNTEQDGTPSATSPVNAVGVGDLSTDKYIIPIKNGSNTVSVDLSAVTSTRKIKKLVLDSTTTFNKGGSGNSAYFVLALGDSAGSSCICTHFVNTPITASNTDIGASITASSMNLRIRPENVADTTPTAFNEWIAEQYTNGTPVTVWYVLATETTGTVNEPLMKIGDYADSVEGAAELTIPLIWGYNTVDVDTTVLPSNMTIQYYDN